MTHAELRRLYPTANHFILTPSIPRVGLIPSTRGILGVERHLVFRGRNFGAGVYSTVRVTPHKRPLRKTEKSGSDLGYHPKGFRK